MATTTTKRRLVKSRKPALQLPIPLQHWFNNQKNVEDLREIMNSPAFMAACAILRQQNLPTLSTISGQESHNLALKQAYLAGHCDFLDSLYRLTTYPIDRVDLEEWAYDTNL
jgi:hypothetical protein